MNTILLPIASLFISVLLTIIYFNKKRIDNKETYIYSKMLIINLFYSILAILIYIFAKIFGDINIIAFMQKVYLILMLLIIIFVVLYNIVIANFNENMTKKIYIFITLSIICFSILILITPLNVINYGDVIDGNGLSYDISMLALFIYIVLVLYSSIYIYMKNKNSFLKETPFITVIILYIIAMIGRVFYPEIICESFLFSFMLLIMYFTIENPDVKMIEQLNLAKDQAEKANLAKTDFLSNMSHEIRTPLNAIVGFSQCILEENNLEDAKEDAKDIITASRNLLEIVNGILDISKIEADKMEIVESNYNPRENFENLAKLMIPRIGDKPIELKTKIAQDIPATLFGDIGKVKQIVTNILTNAAKYTDQGEINFIVNCINANNESSLIISVEDTGRGIKPDQIDKLFNKFERLDEDRNTTTEGTGLGLAITKRLVEMMGGRIVVQSKYGEGSKFTIYLKQKIVNQNELIIEKEENRISTINDFSNKKILIVDDNKINVKVAERLLRDYKVNIESVFSGFECLEKLNNGNKYDLILLDDMMPKMSGVETLKELNKIENFNTPCVALTANAISGMKEKYLKAGFDDYLSKPIDKVELSNILNKFLNK